MKKIILLLLSLSVYSQEVDTVEEIVTVGTKASLKSAIDKQREADQVVSIVDSDALGEFPCLLYTSPSPRDATLSRMPSSA